MHSLANLPFGTIVPTLRYRDVAAAIAWLCNAFGFERHLVVPGEDGTVRYAELTFGGGMIMLGPVEDTAFDELMTQPHETGGAETQICYQFVEDAAAHCARAKAAGAEIVLDIEEADGGGRGYSCRDPEGHLWNFGTYNPWKRQAAEAAQAAAKSERRSGGIAGGLGRAVLMSGLLVALAASVVVVAWALGTNEPIGRELEPVAAAGTPADAAASSEHEQLARAREAHAAAEHVIKDVREQLARERGAKEAAERAAKDSQEQFAHERSAREAAERAARKTREAQEQLAAERSARLAAERASQQALEELARERSAQEAAERAEKEARERRQHAARRAPRRYLPAEPPITPYIIWPK